MNDTPQIGSGAPFDVLGFFRKLIPFSHFPFRNGQKDGRGQQLIATFGGAGAQTFTMALGHVPSEWVVMSQTGAGDLFATTADRQSWTPNSIILRSNAGPVTYHVWVV